MLVGKKKQYRRYFQIRMLQDSMMMLVKMAKIQLRMMLVMVMHMKTMVTCVAYTRT